MATNISATSSNTASQATSLKDEAMSMIAERSGPSKVSQKSGLADASKANPLDLDKDNMDKLALMAHQLLGNKMNTVNYMA